MIRKTWKNYLWRLLNMSNYLSLVKVFLRSLSMRDADDKKKKAINKILVGFVSIFVMLPFALICMFFVMSMTGVLKEYGYATTGLEVMCILISIFSFVFGFNVILNEFYFMCSRRKHMRKHHIGIPIVCLDKDTYELLNTYDSAAEAENDRGIPQRSIRSCCTRENNLCGGYRWMNLTDYNEWINEQKRNHAA